MSEQQHYTSDNGHRQPYLSQPPYAPQNGLGVAGFVLALVGLVLFWIPVLGLILEVLGLVLSCVGLMRMPRGLAIAGLVISLIGLIIILALGGMIVGLLTAPWHGMIR